MANIIVGAILILIFFVVIKNIIRQKKSGSKCMGCSSGSSCKSHNSNNDSISNTDCNCDKE